MRPSLSSTLNSMIVNPFLNLGKRIPGSKVVRKILRSLPRRFRPKVTAIEEGKNVDLVSSGTCNLTPKPTR